MATGETYTSLQNDWLIGRTSICKFITSVYRAILAEFQEEYLCCPNSPEEWKRVEKFKNRWNVPHTVGAKDGKYIAMKKPKKSGSDYYNYKGFFSLVLLALINAEYRFLWVDCGSSGSCSDAQIFSRSDLREKIKDGSLGLLVPESLWEGAPDLHYFLLGDNTFMPWMVKPYRRQLTKEERIANFRISRDRRVVEKRLWNLSELVQGYIWAPWSKDQVLSGTLCYVSSVAQHAEDIPGRSRQGTQPSK